MAVETKYICDKCQAVQPTSEQMWDIGVSFSHCGADPYQPGQYTQHKQMWCRKCMVANGLLAYPLISKTADPPPPPPGLEDLIRELVRSEVEANR